MVAEGMPVAVSNPAAARAANAVPTTPAPVWVASSPMMAMTVVLPVPAAPTPMSMLFPDLVN